MTMFHHSILVLLAIAAAFAVAKKLSLNTEISMLLSAVIGLFAHVLLPKGVDPRSSLPFAEAIRHLVEGSFTYFDVCLIFMTATFFMSLYKESGGVAFIVRRIVLNFHNRRSVCLLLLVLVMMIPGAITGSGATTVLTVGSLVGSVLLAMNVPANKRVALIFLLAAMSAACPPINLWAMMAAAGANMPYVGFARPLALLSVTGAIFAAFWLAGKGKAVDMHKALSTLPEVPEGWNWYRAAAPFLILATLILAGRAYPYSFPVLGLPLTFMISALAVYFISPSRLPVFSVAQNTVKNLLSLVSIMVVVGVLIQVMTLSGVRGLLSLTVVTLPLSVLFFSLWLILPISEGILQYAVAPLFGVPLIMLFNMKGLDPVVSLAAWSVMWPLGDCLPPTAVVGRAAVMELDFEGDYYQGFVKKSFPVMAFILLLSTLFMVYSKEISEVIGG